MFLLLIAIVSIVIWSTLSRDLVKSSEVKNKQKNRRKVITLMSAGTLSTIILTISLFQNLQS
ncbi:hypothetical protein KGR20_18725 [Cytobacillus oceanisediminis]|uniref:Uncharacterized protein n=1 Tax=Niallia alba TaxID=2729105 RepID=A0A7Y0K8N7_9BACI|nr:MULTISPECIES: hypothetical protein [Bacillaceae]MBZ9536212.1 hypothetical protein [Cytobacillus oceanisediminis]NMO77578.1 hypothetical protein [Niallia alba]